MRTLFSLIIFGILAASFQCDFAVARLEGECSAEIAMKLEEERQITTRDPNTRGRRNCTPTSYEDFQSKLWNRHYFKLRVVCESNPYLLEDKDFDVYYDAEFCTKSLGL